MKTRRACAAPEPQLSNPSAPLSPASAAPRLAILGAGPIGLEAAAAFATGGYRVTIYERGLVGSAVRSFGHVRLFSPWKMNRSELGARLVRESAPELAPPDPDACPRGTELVSQYLAPLARAPLLRGRIRERCRVVAVSRAGMLRAEGVGDPVRARHPFRILLEDQDGERIDEAEVVIDATGTYWNPAPAGAGGIPAPGEADAERDPAGRLVRHLEDIAGEARGRYAGERVLVIGAGYSAATAIAALSRVAADAPGTRVTWALRGKLPPLAEIAADPLVGRAALAREVNRLAATPPAWLTLLPGHTIERFEPEALGIAVTLGAGAERHRASFARVLSLTGYGPDASIHRGLQVHECYATRGPMKLAAALAGMHGGDCLAMPETAADTLRNPEPGFFILGAKSYGTQSTFLLRTGLTQVRDLAALLAADALAMEMTPTGSAGG